jgi:hypothetical protein
VLLLRKCGKGIGTHTLTLALSHRGRGEYMSSLWREGVRGKGIETSVSKLAYFPVPTEIASALGDSQ